MAAIKDIYPTDNARFTNEFISMPSVIFEMVIGSLNLLIPLELRSVGHQLGWTRAAGKGPAPRSSQHQRPDHPPVAGLAQALSPACQPIVWTPEAPSARRSRYTAAMRPLEELDPSFREPSVRSLRRGAGLRPTRCRLPSDGRALCCHGLAVMLHRFNPHRAMRVRSRPSPTPGWPSRARRPSQRRQADSLLQPLTCRSPLLLPIPLPVAAAGDGAEPNELGLRDRHRPCPDRTGIAVCPRHRSTPSIRNPPEPAPSH